MPELLQSTLLAASLASLGFLGAAFWLAGRFFDRRRPPAGAQPPISVLKPLCGQETGLEENLRSFCRQDYPRFQVVFGIRSDDDPAIPTVRKIMAEFPHAELNLVMDSRTSGANLKASNLANMYPAARHDLLVVADSDMRVESAYLAGVAAAFADPEVGAVTCLYSGTPAGGLASALGALYITDWFLPSALVATALREPGFCFGATMAVRRQVLEEIGGFQALAGYLADDYMLGHLVRQTGRRVRVAPYVVENIVAEPDLGHLWRHELRWGRTIRGCRPAGYAFTFLSNNTLTLTLLYWAAAGFRPLQLLPAAAALALRLALHLRLRRRLPQPPPFAPGLLPIRDLLCLAVWAASYLGRNVTWRQRSLSVGADGRLQQKPAGRGGACGT